MRCVLEDDAETRSLLATTLGEIGAIDSNHVGDISTEAVDSSFNDGSWRLLQPPWQSTVTRYELQLVTKHLVIALKAAPTSADQHKIAFTIQQLLVLLDESSKQSAPGEKSDADASIASFDPVNDSNKKFLSGPSKTERGDMNAWLVAQLRKAGVLEIIEPFWSTSFNEVNLHGSDNTVVDSTCAHDLSYLFLRRVSMFLSENRRSFVPPRPTFTGFPGGVGSW